MGNFISISFDDGREDNYRIAWNIMKKYNIIGTFFVTTGYIDGTWNTSKWSTSLGAMTVSNIQEMHMLGCEIAAHGNRHVSEIGDIDVSISKLKSWGVVKDNVGFSAPCSVITDDFFKHLKDLGIAYVRMGRNKKCSSFLYRAIHKMFVFFKTQFLYNLYYEQCVNDLTEIKPESICALPLLCQDDADHLIKFIEKNNNKWIVLMFHSILPENEANYAKDEYCWSEKKFEKLCQYLYKSRTKNEVRTILDVIESYK